MRIDQLNCDEEAGTTRTCSIGDKGTVCMTCARHVHMYVTCQPHETPPPPHLLYMYFFSYTNSIGWCSVLLSYVWGEGVWLTPPVWWW